MGQRSEDPFTVNIPTTAGGDGQDITFKMTASLPLVPAPAESMEHR